MQAPITIEYRIKHLRESATVSTQKRLTGLKRTLGLLAGSLAIGLSMPVLFPARAIAQTTPFTDLGIDQLNIFGDSVSDAGNIFALSQGLFPPSPPYAGRLSNGPVWVEAIASELGLTPQLSATALPPVLAGITPPPADGINYAVAGSLSSDVNVGGPPLPGLQQQIAAFTALSQSGAPPSENALQVLLAGANDYNEAVLTATPTTDLSALVEQVTNNIVGATSALFNAGAKNVLVSNLPLLGFQPFADSVDVFNPEGSNILTALANEHNLLLDQKLTALASTLNPSSATITQFDLEGLTSDIIADPGAFGFDNAEDSCLINFQIDGVFDGVCENPDKFFFWDDVHPTTVGHSVIAQAALQALADANGDTPVLPTPGGGATDVPEPTSVLALLAVGGVLVGGFGRKRAA